jgi:predicted PurR-regulated permease PerM
MESETRNTGIMVAVVVTAIIIILLVIFLRPKETVREVVKEEQNAVLSVEDKVERLESRVNQLEKTLGALNGFESKIRNLETQLNQNEKELNSLKSRFTTIIVFAVIILIVFVIVIIGILVKSGKINVDKIKKKVTKNFDEKKDDTLNDYGWTTVEGNNDSENDENEEKEIFTKENEEFEQNHGTYDDLSKKEKKSLLNDEFTPEDMDE